MSGFEMLFFLYSKFKILKYNFDSEEHYFCTSDRILNKMAFTDLQTISCLNSVNMAALSKSKQVNFRSLSIRKIFLHNAAIILQPIQVLSNSANIRISKE